MNIVPESKRGLVYHRQDGALACLTFDEAGKPEVWAMSDDDRFYSELPSAYGQVVIADVNEVAQIMVAKSLCDVSLWDDDRRYEHFWEGVGALFDKDPQALAKLMREAPCRYGP